MKSPGFFTSISWIITKRSWQVWNNKISKHILELLKHLSMSRGLDWSLFNYQKFTLTTGISAKPGKAVWKIPWKARLYNQFLFIQYPCCSVITVSQHMYIFKPLLLCKTTQHRNVEKRTKNTCPIFTNSIDYCDSSLTTMSKRHFTWKSNYSGTER